MNTPPMSLPDTIAHAQRMVATTNSNTWRSVLHHLETGKRLREAVENLRDQKGRYNTGAAYEKLMALLSPQPPQQPSPPAPYYTADGRPLQYHEVSGGGGCGAIPVEPPKRSPQT